MPQNPLAATVSVGPTGQQAPQVIDAFGNVNVVGNPANTQLGITTASVVKATPGLVGRVSVIVAGSAAGSVNDCATTGAAAASNALAAIPNTLGTYTIEMYAKTGIVVVPGTGQTVAISFD